jgi:hypothetical protein
VRSRDSRAVRYEQTLISSRIRSGATSRHGWDAAGVSVRIVDSAGHEAAPAKPAVFVRGPMSSRVTGANRQNTFGVEPNLMAVTLRGRATDLIITNG